MKFLKLLPGFEFEVIESGDDTLTTLQNAVGGWIAQAGGYFDLPEGVEAWVDDEGLLKEDYDYSVIFRDRDMKFAGGLAGPVVFARYDEEGNTLGLSSEDINDIRSRIINMPICVIEQRNGHAAFVPVKDVTVC